MLASMMTTPEAQRLLSLYNSRTPNAHLTSSAEQQLKNHVEQILKSAETGKKSNSVSVAPLTQDELDALTKTVQKAKDEGRFIQATEQPLRMDVVEISPQARLAQTKIQHIHSLFDENGNLLDKNGKPVYKVDPIEIRHYDKRLIQMVETDREAKRKGITGYSERLAFGAKRYQEWVQQTKKNDYEVYVYHLIQNKSFIENGTPTYGGLPKDYTIQDYYREIRPLLNDNPNSVFYRKNV